MKPVPVGLLSCTQANWKQFIDAAMEAVGFSPTRGLDSVATPTHRDPAAFLACLDLKNQPLEALRNGRQQGLFRHFFMSFMCIVDEETVIGINEMTNISTWSTQTHQRLYFVAMSGTIEAWHDAIVSGCRETVPWELRSVLNGVYNILLNTGFREAFPYTKHDHRDGTFTLND